MWLIKFVLVLVLAAALTDQKKCSVDLKLELTQDLQSPKIVLQSTPNANCSYRITAPDEYKIGVSCEDDREIYLRNQSGNNHSSACNQDGVFISLTGNENHISDIYCGAEEFHDKSVHNRLFLRMHSSSDRLNFLCTLSLVAMHCRCGYKHENTGSLQRIVNGTVAVSNEFPMMAALAFQQHYPIGIQSPFCGATIITDRFALSAAHCLQEGSDEYDPYPNNIMLIVGEWKNNGQRPSVTPRKHKVFHTIIHPGYTEETGPNDIALVQTVSRIEFNAIVGPACLPWKYRGSSFIGKTVEVAGWGNTRFRGPDSAVLRKVTLDVIDNESCATRYGSNITSGQLCTYTPNKDSCQGDSGGPLLYSELGSKRLYLVGIVSYGKKCAKETPAVNTRVTEYLDWIEEQTRGSSYCRI